jgi:hypothetical protein
VLKNNVCPAEAVPEEKGQFEHRAQRASREITEIPRPSSTPKTSQPAFPKTGRGAQE